MHDLVYQFNEVYTNQERKSILKNRLGIESEYNQYVIYT